MEIEKYDKALQYINRALAINKDNVDFLRNKSLALMAIRDYYKAEEVIQSALGLDPSYPKLKETQSRIEREVEREDIETTLFSFKENLKKQEKGLRRIRLEFIEISALFVAILTLVVRIVTFDYVNYQNLTFLQIIWLQIALNFPWITGIIIICLLVIFIHLKNK